MTATRSRPGGAPLEAARPRAPSSRAWTAAAAGAVGFVVAAALMAGHESAQVQQSRHDELLALVGERQEHVDALGERLEDVRGEVAAIESGAHPTGSTPAEVAEVERAAGMTALAGPGVRVVLDDAGDHCTSSDPADCHIRDTDLQHTVNALFAAGAEAIAVNGERLVATSAIRNAGRSVMANYRVLTPPYEVAAVGRPDTLLAEVESSDVAADFAAWSDVFGLGFEVEAADDLVLPAYGGSVSHRVATPREDHR